MKSANISILERLPAYLRQYVTDQNYEVYSQRDQSAWRFIMRQNRAYFRKNAHSMYVDGLKKTGIPVHRIPRISEMNECLAEFGWGAAPVSGFIPPAAFLGFQAHKVLPIATQMRRLENIAYTPAPDIVHEAAGHAPILADPSYREYLASYAEVARKAILNIEDLQLYEAIRTLSDVKEDPSCSAADIVKAEQSFEKAKKSVDRVSEATKMSRMAWWTTEYGLLKENNQFKIYGAGLLSSVGESQACLNVDVEKRRLSKSCVDQGYDITNYQPQLYVADSVEHLHEVLKDFSQDLAYARGGKYGLRLAQESGLPASAVYEDGLTLSGVIESFETNGSAMQLIGPLQLGIAGNLIAGAESIKEQKTHFQRVPLDFDCSGFQKLSEALFSCLHEDGSLRVVYLTEKPDSLPVSVFGGPQDRESFGTQDVGQASTQPGIRPSLTARQQEVEKLYASVRAKRTQMLTRSVPLDRSWFLETVEKLQQFPSEWVLIIELLELEAWAGTQTQQLQQLRAKVEKTMLKETRLLWQLGVSTLGELDYEDQTVSLS